MQVVHNIDGHEIKVMDHEDLLGVERYIRRWLLGIIGGLVLGAMGLGAGYSSLRNTIAANTLRIEEVRAEGSVPLNEVKRDIAVIRVQLEANAERQLEILGRLERMGR